MAEASLWLQQNYSADPFFLVIESFDPHEPWFVPEWYRRPYDDTEGPEQVISFYESTDCLSEELIRRTRANYSGLVTMCDRWFGHLCDTLSAQGRWDDTLVIVTADHGHSIGDRDYMGKRGYPSSPEVYDLPLFIRHPQGTGAGQRSDLLVQHTDIAATILDLARVQPSRPMEGRSFWKQATQGGQPIRDHVTVGWGSAITVIKDQWWLNIKVNGKGAFLHNLADASPFATNLADKQPAVVREMFAIGAQDASGGFPDFLLKMAEEQEDAPGCSALAARTL
jgi:arylsulfatase A-like enzyme